MNSEPGAAALKKWLDQTPTAFHSIRAARNSLIEGGWTEYKSMRQTDHLAPGTDGFLIKDDLGLIAFSAGAKALGDNKVAKSIPDRSTTQATGRHADHLYLFPRMIVTHADSPSLVLKPNALQVNQGYLQLAVEIYGGAILSSWFDRPLYPAGQVIFEDSDRKLNRALVELKDWRVVLPNVAIHLNPKQNEGQSLSSQAILTPLLGDIPEDTSETFDPHTFIRLKIAQHLRVEPDRVLNYTLSLHPYSPAVHAGPNDEWILSDRLDNQGMVEAAVSAFRAANAAEHSGLNILIIANHEEVGSLSSSGAKSMWFRDTLTSIYELLGFGAVDIRNAFQQGFIISADQAHALHPNFSDLSDATNLPRINRGPVIKTAAAQSYATSALAELVFRNLCAAVGAPCQTFTNKTGVRGGSTVGPIISSIFPSPSIDVGNPILAMHSCCETGGVRDQMWMKAVFHEFFTVDELMKLASFDSDTECGKMS